MQISRSRGFASILILIIVVLVAAAAGYWYWHMPANGPKSATIVSNDPAWATYTNSYHGYSINYPTDLALNADTPAGLSYWTDRGVSLPDAHWWNTTCVQLSTSDPGIFIAIVANVSGVDNCGEPTGTSGTSKPNTDAITVDGKAISAQGRVEPDYSSGNWVVDVSPNLRVVYTVDSSTNSPSDFQAKLAHIHEILATLKINPQYTLPAPLPDDGVRG